MDYEDKKFAVNLRELILKEKIDRPLVFRGLHKDWEPCKWTLDNWGDLFKNEKLSVRYGKQRWDNLQPQWESDCGKEELTWKELMDWTKGDYVFLPQNGNPEDIWVYYDYKYLPDVFQLNSKDSGRDFLKLIYFNENLKKSFSWKKLGFDDRNGDHSTLWVGSSGSYTPCHFDTYSSNLVCQVLGRKTWLLFPPKDVEHLQPTRVPYEESSVYSRINFASTKRRVENSHDFEKCTPFKVTLEAGDCLFLPPKWWHFVKSDDFSISVNTWVELPGDHSTRIEEAVLRSFVSSLANMTFPETAKRILNPNEIDVANFSETDVCDMLQATTSAYIEMQGAKMIEATLSSNGGASKSNSEVTENQEPQSKRLKIESKEVTLSEFMDRYAPIVQPIDPCSSDSLIHDNPDKNVDKPVPEPCQNDVRSPTYLEHLIDAIGHPTVLKQISAQFLHNVSQNPPK